MIARLSVLALLLSAPVLADETSEPDPKPPAAAPETETAKPETKPPERETAARAKEPDLADRWAGQRVPPPHRIVNFAIGAAAVGVLHESTHKYFAEKSGWDVYEFRPLPFFGKTRWETPEEDHITDDEQIRFSLYAPLATRLFSESLVLGLKTRRIPPPAEALVASTALVGRLDGYWQIVKAHSPRGIRGDDSDWAIGSRAMGIDKRWGIAFLAGDLALDLFVRGDLELLWDLATGRRSLWDERREGKKWTASAGMADGRFFASVDFRF